MFLTAIKKDEHRTRKLCESRGTGVKNLPYVMLELTTPLRLSGSSFSEWEEMAS